jgi:hypothetical protein
MVRSAPHLAGQSDTQGFEDKNLDSKMESEGLAWLGGLRLNNPTNPITQ